MDITILILKAIVYAVICYLISGMIHELGHVAMGVLNGWQFYMLIVGPFRWKRERPGRKVKFGLEKNILLWGGIGGTYPINRKKDNLKVWSWVLMAGPAASVALSLAVFPFAIATKSLFLLFLAVMPLGMGIACGLPLPLKTGLLYSDGGRWIRLKRGGQEAEEEKALFLLMELGKINGEDALPEESMIRPLLLSREPVMEYYGLYYRYQIEEHENNQQALKEVLARMEELKPGIPKLVIEDCRIIL